MHYSTKSNQETGATVYCPSDGSELIPAEVKFRYKRAELSTT